VQKSKLFTLIFFFTCVNFVAFGCMLSTSHWPQFSLCLKIQICFFANSTSPKFEKEFPNYYF
jgi:hypothetical protein